MVPNELFLKYQNFSLIQCLKADPTAKWCPHPGCDMVIVGENESGSDCVECPSCRKPFCYQCNQIWHKGLSCAENQKSHEEDDPKYVIIQFK